MKYNMKISSKVLAALVIAGTLTWSTPASAFTDQAIKLAREWILKNGEKIARGVYKAIVAAAIGANSSVEDIETYNNKTDSICTKGSEGLAGCADFLTGGTTVRSCGGILCKADPDVALMIEATCGVLSSRDRMKAAEFETSECAKAVWGKINPGTLEQVTKGSIKDVNDFKRQVTVGIAKVFAPNLVGNISEKWGQGQVDAQLKEWLENDKLGLIQESVSMMAQKASDIEAMRAALNNPEGFALEVATALKAQAPSATAQQAAAGLAAGSRKTVSLKPGAEGAPAPAGNKGTATVKKLGSGRGGAWVSPQTKKK